MLAAVCLGSSGMSEPAYFADGYHGGVYGHYPRSVHAVPGGYAQGASALEDQPRDRAGDLGPGTEQTTRHAYQEFKALAEDQILPGRIEFVNPAYGQASLWNISGENCIRQLSYGMREVSRALSGVIFTTYASEEACFTSALPGIPELARIQVRPY